MGIGLERVTSSEQRVKSQGMNLGYHFSKLENLGVSDLVSLQLTILDNENKFQFVNLCYFSSSIGDRLYMKGPWGWEMDIEPLLAPPAAWVLSHMLLQPKGLVR